MDEIERTGVVSGYEALNTAGATAVVERDVVLFAGPDSGRFLQGQLSQDVVALAEGSSTWSLLLQPNGKVLAWLRVHRVSPDAYALDVDPDHGDEVVARLARFLLRTKAEFSSPQRRVALARRHGAQRVEIGLVPTGAAAAPGALAGVVVGPGVAGIDRILPPGTTMADLGADERPHDLVPAAAFERYRIAHGVPAVGSELTDETIPGEAGQWLIGASVSFTKGCYTGQELVARIDSRGNTVPKPIRLVQLGDGTFPIGAGPDVGTVLGFAGKEVGRLTSVAVALGPGYPALALAVVGRAVPLGGEVGLGSDSDGITGLVVDPAAGS